MLNLPMKTSKHLQVLPLRCANQSVSSLLLSLSNQLPFTYTVDGNTLTFAKKEPVQRKKGIYGQVTDVNGDPIIGAIIRIDGVNGGYTTDINGEYQAQTDLKRHG